MTRDDIIRVARESGCLDEQHYGSTWTKKLERFAALVAEAEREECVKVCEEIDKRFASEERWTHSCGAADCAHAIKARGQWVKTGGAPNYTQPFEVPND